MTRKTHTIDAANKSLGRLATEIVLLLRGKNKPDFVPNVDAGDFVVIKNVKNLNFKGKKLDQKMYYRHSGYIGNLKKSSLREVFGKNPAKVVRGAVLGMLPKNKLRAQQIKRLKIK